jgi:alpha-L-arabinofuranosidase
MPSHRFAVNAGIRITSMLMLVLIAITAHGQVHVTIHIDTGKDSINRNIYGHFSEHLGHCIYGGFYVGDANTDIPHTRGMRKDVVAAMKKLRIPVLRWPGGCFADTYHWKDGIGPKEQRPSMVNVWWGGITEDNSFGTHEFLDLCEQIGAEPYFSGNVGSGTVEELKQWVQYVNTPSGNPMAALRAQNGRTQPWKVRFWGIGNEAWGCGGEMRAEHYVDVYRTYVTFMGSGWGSRGLFRIASGASDDDYHWTDVLMRDIPLGLLDGVALHHYSVIDWGKKSSATQFTTAEYAASLRAALRTEELIQKHVAIMDKYDPKKKVALVVDEWGGWYNTEPGTNPSFLYQQNTMRDAMIAGVSLNIFNNHCDRVRMANLAQTVNVLQAVVLTDGPKMLLTPTYHVMEMYNVHQDALMLPVETGSLPFSIGKDTLQAISVSASRGRDGVTSISLVNIDPATRHEVVIDMRGQTFSTLTGRILVGRTIQDHNTFDAPDQVAPKEFKEVEKTGTGLKLALPPCSVVVLRCH